MQFEFSSDPDCEEDHATITIAVMGDRHTPLLTLRLSFAEADRLTAGIEAQKREVRAFLEDNLKCVR